MKATITQKGMDKGYWCIIEYEADGKTVKIIRSPFKTEEEALTRAKDISKIRYDEEFTRILEKGEKYIITHSRKGTFQAEILEDTGGDWITIGVTKGRAAFVAVMNSGRGVPGDHFDVRRSFCTFKKVKAEDA